MTTQYIKKSFSGLYCKKIGLFSYHWFTPYDAGILQRKNHIPIRNFQGWKNPTPNFYKYEKKITNSILALLPSLFSEICKIKTSLQNKNMTFAQNFRENEFSPIKTSFRPLQFQLKLISWCGWQYSWKQSYQLSARRHNFH